MTSRSSTMARIRRRAWATPSLRWRRRPARRRVKAPFLSVTVVAQAEVTPGAGAGRQRLRCRPVGLARGASADGPVRPLLVVGTAEGIELGLQLGEGARSGLLPEPALERLVEALDLALGLGMPGCSVPLADAEPGEQVLEGVVAAGEARGVDRAVVGERGRGVAMRLTRRAEGGHHVVAIDPVEGRAAEQVAGVVVEPGADLDLAPVRESPVGHVRLPDLVGHGGLEAVPRAARALAWLGRDEARGTEDAPDRRGRGRVQALALEVPGDRHGPGVEALLP